MSYKKILTVQDISCVGQCSLTVALPILSVCGCETCVLPTSVLSTHTSGFKGFTVRDLSADFSGILEHWKKENINFDAVYTGYLGNVDITDHIMRIFASFLKENALKVVDPAMADNGKLYPAFDSFYVNKIKELCRYADIILPNITEACLMTDTPYRETYDAEYIAALLRKIRSFTQASVVLTGVGYNSNSTGVAVMEKDDVFHYNHRKINRLCHGTGDVYASAFVGMYLRGKSLYDAAVSAAEFTLKCIENTMDDKNHWYGVKFETVLGDLLK